MMANQDITYYAGTDDLLTISTSEIDLVDGGSTKTVNLLLKDVKDDDTVTTISSGITVTATGTPSTFTVQPNATLKALTEGTYSLVIQATDSGALVEKSTPYNKFYIVSQ